MHSFLKINTPVKIINPENSKVIESKIYKKAKYPKIFNVVISQKIASTLELDVDNPYVEIIEIKKNKTFIAKKSNTFEEEKNVAEKAPVGEIEMDVLSVKQSKIKKKRIKNNNFILVINDFYYLDSAENLMKDLIKKSNLNNEYTFTYTRAFDRVFSLSGIMASFLLAISRAIGDTMAVTLAAGATPNMTIDPFVAIQTMTAYIVQVSLGDTPQGGVAYQTIFAVSTLLFFITLCMNIFSGKLLKRFREVYE